MIENPFNIIYEDKIPRMLGREKILDNLHIKLTKTNPVNVSVIGPKGFGKTVILNKLAKLIETGNNEYLSVCYWDLRHHTPRSDEEFRKQLAQRVKEVLKKVSSPLEEYLEMDYEYIFDLLVQVFDDLYEEDKRILVVLDGFDYLMERGSLTRNLWDNLLDLVRKQSLRLVTGSRSRLREICRTEESRTSDFWEIFDTPVEVAFMDENDLEGMLIPFKEKNIEFQSSARKELMNWTGGIPILLAGFLNRLFDVSDADTIIPGERINKQADEFFESFTDYLAEIWNDCPVKCLFDLEELSKGDILSVEIPPGRKAELKKRGLVREASNYIKSSCRLMKKYAGLQSEGLDNMRRFFGDEKKFDRNIRNLLQIRLENIQGEAFDKDLRLHIEYALRDMLPNPGSSLTWIRNITREALELAWKKELPQDKKLPQEWTDAFKELNYNRSYFQESSFLPSEEGPQLEILRLVSGARGIPKLTRYISKSTYLLLNHLKSVGDFGQHRSEIIDMGFAASICLTAIELYKNLVKELKEEK